MIKINVNDSRIRYMKRLCYNKRSMKEPMKKGFTLVELSLSLVFIGVLSLTIAMIISDTVGTYRRGVTLNLINTVGMDIVDDVRSAVQNSSSWSPDNFCLQQYRTESAPRELCVKDGGRNFVSLTRKTDVEGIGKKIPVYGVFCTGTYSYIWNSGYFFNGRISSTSLKPVSVGSPGNNDFRLLKVRDVSRSVCVSLTHKITEGLSNKYKINDSLLDKNWEVIELDGTEPIEIIATGSSNSSMALYDFEVFGPATSVANNSVFYSVSFVLGTLEGGANITGSGNLCATPNDYSNTNENFDYCAINKFNFAAEALGGYHD